MQPRKSHKIFIGPCEIAGYYGNLAMGLSNSGERCDYITLSPHPFGYEKDGVASSRIITLLRFIRHIRTKKQYPKLLDLMLALLGKMFFLPWVVFVIFRYDVFIFGFGETLLPSNFDLKVIRSLRKKSIINLAHGAEARPPYIDGAYQSLDGKTKITVDQLAAKTLKMRKKIERLENYADVIIAAPLSTSPFLSKPAINTHAIGLPFFSRIDGGIEEKKDIFEKNGPSTGVKVLHAPSHPAAKGSPKILGAIERLKAKGHEIELILISGRPHAEVIEQLQRCDFVVDQVYSDTPMAGLATEAAWFGKPAVVGGYGFDQLKKFIASDNWPPSKICHPDELETAIEEMIVNTNARMNLGLKAQQFVRDNWSSNAVALRYLNIIKGAIPKNWLYDPTQVEYCEGAGQPIELSKANIIAMVASYGKESLQLRHRPKLEQAFLKFAGIKVDK